MNHEKMEAIKQLILAAIVITIIAGLLHYLNKPERVRLAKVQSGELVLECNMRKTGLTVIDPEKVTGHSDGTWWFTNGVSSRCTTKGATR